MSACPHCRRPVVRNRLRAHVAVCLGDPAVATRIKRALAKYSPYGVLLSRFDYTVLLAGRDGLPCAMHLRRYIGTWDEVARWAGLMPHRQLSEVLWRACREFLSDLAYRLHDGEYGPSAQEWEEFRDPHLPSSSKLLSRFTTWSNVLSWGGGFSCAEESYYKRRQKERDAAALLRFKARNEPRERLIAVEQELEEQMRKYPPDLTVGETREAMIYDWTRHCWRKRALATVR